MPEAVDPLRREVLLSVAPARAWAAWTQQINLWWPPSHRRFEAGTLRLEPGTDGRLVEQAPDGAEHDLGRVVVWQPPHHLAYDFFPGAGPGAPTRVQVWFHPRDGGGTRVEILHRPGALDAARWSGGVDRFRRSWDHLLPLFAALAAPSPPLPPGSVP